MLRTCSTDHTPSALPPVQVPHAPCSPVVGSFYVDRGVVAGCGFATAMVLVSATPALDALKLPPAALERLPEAAANLREAIENGMGAVISVDKASLVASSDVLANQ
eukprot:1299542-Pyramimonas_sp.AAC.1